jgi:tetratricopeptide (TPR) repeat protein
LGGVYANQKRYSEAIAVYDESIKANKQDFRPVLAKALVLKEQGKTAEAKPLFTTAVSLAPAQYKDQVERLAADTPTPAPTSSPSASQSSTPTDSQAPTDSTSPAQPQSPASSN